MASNLAAAGLLVAVWNRTGEKAAAFAREHDVDVAGSPQELAARCNVVLTCVSADPDLESVIGQMAAGLEPGDVVVDTSTVNPLTAQSLAERLAESGVGFVDAPVSGGVEGAIRGTLSVMAGGESADIERIRPVLEAISGTVTHMGPVGSGQATKAVNQVIVAGVAEGVCEALALAEKLNLPSVRLLSVLGAGAAGSWFLEHRGASMLENRFDTGFKPALLLKDLKIVRELARDLDIELNTVDRAIKDYEDLLAGGNEDNDISGLIRLKRGSDAGK
jgi:3-hydroxyisobutyrate dehydrogenase